MLDMGLYAIIMYVGIPDLTNLGACLSHKLLSDPSCHSKEGLPGDISKGLAEYADKTTRLVRCC